jgi:RND family efflux transporter MFP subunit
MANESRSKPDLTALRINRDEYREAGGGKRLRTVLWVAIPVVIIVIFVIYFKQMTAAIEVKIGTATILTQAQSQSILSATGYVVAQRKASVASKGTGRLEYLGVEEGDAVTKGQVIGRLENSDMIATLDLARAGLEQVRAESTEAALEYNRQKQLLSSGSTTQAAYEISQAQSGRATAGVKSAIANIKAAEVALENTIIRAPFDGTVLMKHADVGEVVAPFASSASSKGSVVDLADMSSLEVEADVSESNIQRVQVGQACEIILDAYPEMRYSGRVKKIVPTADRSRATVLTKVSFNNIDSKVLPEMSARINFFQTDSLKNETAADSAVAVPSSALVVKGDKRFVFVVDDNKAREIQVASGRKIGSLTEILSGIMADQKVVIAPPPELKSGDKIKISLQ